MIEVHELTKRYGDIVAIDRVSFKVEQGEILGFLGPNGAGKSTTMRILTGALGATEGKAMVAGFDVAERPKEAKRRFGYLPEIPPVYPEMTVASYVDYAARLHGVPGGRRKAAVAKTLEACNLASVSHRLVGHLSKGFQQRVGLAQALVHDPEVLILDEPTIGLDPNQISEIRSLIKSLAGKHTVILSTHILPEVQMTCQKVVIINRGRIVAQDTIENLTAQVQKSERLYLVLRRPTPTTLAELEKLAGVEHVVTEDTPLANLEAPVAEHRFVVQGRRGTDLREELARLAVGRDWGLLEVGKVKLSLEEVFRELTMVEQAPETVGEVSA